MNYRTTAAAAYAVILCCCMALPARAAPPSTRPSFLLGKVDDKSLSELSGLAPSRRYPGVFYGHNDSGNPAELFALDIRGHVIARIPVAAAPNTDWEDIATDEQGRLYLSDTGNNTHNRTEVYVYRLDEPATDPRTPTFKPTPLRPTACWRLHYPAAPFDCEALVIRAGQAYVLPKLRTFEPASLYRFPITNDGGNVILQKVCDLPSVRPPVTGADLTPDGKYLAVLTVLGPYVFQVDGDLLSASRGVPAHVTFASLLLEACCWTDDGLLTGTEPGDLMLFRWDQLALPKPDPAKK